MTARPGPAALLPNQVPPGTGPLSRSPGRLPRRACGRAPAPGEPRPRVVRWPHGIGSTFRSRLAARDTLHGAWSVIPSPLSVRLLAAAGFDYVVIDLQHGGATERDLPGMTSAIRLAGATPIGRVRHAHPADIGRALDLGCAGVITPNVNSAAHAREVAGAVRYPPAGYRSAGGVLAADEPFCIVMVESAEAVADLDATLAIDGVDGVYVGPGICPSRSAVRSTRTTRCCGQPSSRSGPPAPPPESPSACTPATAAPPATTATPAAR